jgi:hypothetical protein
MAGDWIKMEVALPEKPEVWQIAGLIGIDPDAVVGKLLKVWRWFDAHTESGNAVGVTYTLVDSISGVTGFGEAMGLCGWLVQDGAILKCPHFDRHNGKTAKNRALTAKRVAEHKDKSNAKGNAVSVTSALPREEKRREEKEEGARKRARSPEVTFTEWLETLPQGEPMVPEGDPIFDWAEAAGIPVDYLDLAGGAFRDRYRSESKRYRDWREVFRKAVKGNWLKIWRAAPGGGYVLTTEGESWRRVRESRLAGQA